MSSNNFPDGFPKDPQEAIEAAFFLTEEEKTEWRTWLPTANEAEKLEFIDTLHSIYTDQKSNEPVQPVPAPAPAPVEAPAPSPVAVQNPNVFGPGSDNATPAPAPQPAPIESAPQTAVPVAPVATPAPAPSATVQDSVDFDFSDLEKELESQSSPAPVPAPAQTQESNQFNFKPEPAESILPDPSFEEVVQAAPVPAPQPAPVEPIAPAPQAAPQPVQADFTPAPQPVEENRGAFLKTPPSFKKEAPKPMSMESETQKQIQRYESDLVKQDREIEEDINNMLAPTKEKSINSMTNALDDDYLSDMDKSEKYEKTAKVSLLSAKQVNDLYDTFLSTQSKSSELEKEYQQRQANLFDKIMEMVTEASVLSDKVLRLNDISIDQARDIKELKIQTSNTGSLSLQSQVNTLREEIRKVERSISFQVESIDREFSQFREEINSKVNDMSVQLASALSDTYKSDGINEKVAKLTARMDMVDGKGDGTLLFKEVKTKKTPKSKSILLDETKEDTKDSSKKTEKKSKGLSLKEIKKSK